MKTMLREREKRRNVLEKKKKKHYPHTTMRQHSRHCATYLKDLLPIHERTTTIPHALATYCTAVLLIETHVLLETYVPSYHVSLKSVVYS